MSAFRPPRLDDRAFGTSVIDWLNTEAREAVLHGFEHFERAPCHSVTSPVTRSGARERYDFVGFPGGFWSASPGSSSIRPGGSTM